MPGADCEQRQAHLTQSSGQHCQTTRIGDTWTAGSRLDCYAECMVRFPDTCQSIVYNTESSNCRPGSAAFGSLANVNTGILGTDSGDEVWYARPSFPACNSTNGDFALYGVCGTAVCLHLSTSKASYSVAKTKCDEMNSRLYVANTMAKFSAFWHVSLNNLNDDTYLGLRVGDEEENTKWGNGERLSADQKQYIWDTNEGEADDEGCAEASHGASPGSNGLNVVVCSKLSYYICEPL